MIRCDQTLVDSEESMRELRIFQFAEKWRLALFVEGRCRHSIHLTYRRNPSLNELREIAAHALESFDVGDPESPEQLGDAERFRIWTKIGDRCYRSPLPELLGVDVSSIEEGGDDKVEGWSHELLTVAEVADLLETTPKAIHCKIYREEFPSRLIFQQKRKGRVLFRRTALIDHLAHLE